MGLVDRVDDLLEADDFKKKCKPSKASDDLKRVGHCYDQAAEAQMFGPSGWLLVHGRPTLQRSPWAEYGHAWLEKGEQVHDPSTGNRLPRMLYYSLGRIDYRENLVYTVEETKDFIRLTNHYGPWEGPEGTPATAKQKKKWKDQGKKMPKRSMKSKKPADLAKELQRLGRMINDLPEDTT